MPTRHILRKRQTVISTRVTGALKVPTNALPTTASDARHAEDYFLGHRVWPAGPEEDGKASATVPVLQTFTGSDKSKVSLLGCCPSETVNSYSYGITCVTAPRSACHPPAIYRATSV
ncbi:hypothetical protein EVAR_67275_1 [Eumeta japonica]|uniref:Uncharacterized protein n=1 Tax=Eumeta variegata TaxID=151549 RepID=A0A4C1ZWX0_EUMVA|nr:hypothetical protein EVAR_67275_1 [Eumeta japonica]